MRLTRAKYERAKLIVEKAKAQLKTVREWEEAVKRIGNVGDQKIVAIRIKDGKITAECEANRNSTGGNNENTADNSGGSGKTSSKREPVVPTGE